MQFHCTGSNLFYKQVRCLGRPSKTENHAPLAKSFYQTFAWVTDQDQVSLGYVSVLQGETLLPLLIAKVMKNLIISSSRRNFTQDFLKHLPTTTNWNYVSFLKNT